MLERTIVIDGYIKSNRFQKTQDNKLAGVFYWWKSKLAVVVLQMLDGSPLVGFLMY